MLDCFNLDISDSIYHMVSEIINEVKNKRMAVFFLSAVISGVVPELRVARNLPLRLPSFPSVIVWQVHTALKSVKNFIVQAVS